jgi:predicted dehydrogenase
MSDFSFELRWGILGCANIVKKILPAIASAGNNTLVAIGSRDLEKAKQFAIENSISNTVALYGSYAEVLSNPDVNAVYIPLPTTLHLEWVTKAANAGKHIIIEKPVAVNASEFHQMIQVCEQNNVFLMDGTMYMHHPRLKLLKDLLNDNTKCGTVQRVQCNFTFPADENFFKTNIRTKASADPLGSLGDLGNIFILSFSQFLKCANCVYCVLTPIVYVMNRMVLC